jgi:hypothetical protein
VRQHFRNMQQLPVTLHIRSRRIRTFGLAQAAGGGAAGYLEIRP